MPILLDGNLGITTPSYGGADAAEYLVPVTAFKNRIINGQMAISQRNGTSAQTINNTTAYSLDRWYVNYTGGSGTVQQVTGTGGFNYAIRLTGGAGVTFGFIGQKIESFNIADCSSSTVTYSIRASSSTLTNLNWTARFPTARDNYAGVTAISNGSITINSTPTTYTFQITLPAGVTNGLEVYFDFGSFTSGTLDITGVQLEKGTTATSFDYRPYGTELALAQRYCQAISGMSIGRVVTNATAGASFMSPVLFRTAPTASNITYTLSVGATGTPATFGASINGLEFYNSASNWTTTALLQVSAILSAEL